MHVVKSAACIQEARIVCMTACYTLPLLEVCVCAGRLMFTAGSMAPIIKSIQANTLSSNLTLRACEAFSSYAAYPEYRMQLLSEGLIACLSLVARRTNEPATCHVARAMLCDFAEDAQFVLRPDLLSLALGSHVDTSWITMAVLKGLNRLTCARHGPGTHRDVLVKAGRIIIQAASYGTEDYPKFQDPVVAEEASLLHREAMSLLCVMCSSKSGAVNIFWQGGLECMVSYLKGKPDITDPLTVEVVDGVTRLVSQDMVRARIVISSREVPTDVPRMFSADAPMKPLVELDALAAEYCTTRDKRFLETLGEMSWSGFSSDRSRSVLDELRDSELVRETKGRLQSFAKSTRKKMDVVEALYNEALKPTPRRASIQPANPDHDAQPRRASWGHAIQESKSDEDDYGSRADSDTDTPAAPRPAGSHSARAQEGREWDERWAESVTRPSFSGDAKSPPAWKPKTRRGKIVVAGLQRADDYEWVRDAVRAQEAGAVAVIRGCPRAIDFLQSANAVDTDLVIPVFTISWESYMMLQALVQKAPPDDEVAGEISTRLFLHTSWERHNRWWAHKHLVPALWKLLDQAPNPGTVKVLRRALCMLGGDTNNWMAPPRCVSKAPPSRGLRILALDGGGVRGMVTLIVLRAIEQITKTPIHKMFDLIVGTSVGGMIATSLAQKMMNAEAILDFVRLIPAQVFARPFSNDTVSNAIGNARAAVWTEKYEVKNLIMLLHSFFGQHSELLEGATEDGVVKCCVVSTQVNSTPPQAFIFRNYNHHPGVISRYPGCSHAKVWQALRAGSAAPGYFPQMLLDGIKLRDGGCIANNPSAVAYHEAKHLWRVHQPRRTAPYPIKRAKSHGVL